MIKQRRGLNRYNLLQDGKKFLYICIIHKKTKCEEKTQEKKTKKTVLTGFEPTSTKIDGS